MIVTYIRSSSYGAHEMCPMRYYMEYTLGWRGPPNQKAEKGTIVHKALEILGEIKVTQQKGKRKTFVDDICGRVHVEKYDFDKIIQSCYDYYSNSSPNRWTKKDLKDCRDWTYKAINYNDGEFDPRNSNIVAAEQPFDFSIEEPWAMYDYELPSGKRMEGFLSMKGTIDQVSKVDDDTYMILDWKTGRRWDWAKDCEKTYETLVNDPQLLIYYYACQRLFPDIKHFMVVIYFINDGGPFTVCFSKEDIPRIDRMLQKKFEDIKNTEIPRKYRSWKCGKFCHFGTNTFLGTDIKPIQERRNGQVTTMGQNMTMCEQVDYCCLNRPQSSVIKYMSAPNHDIDFYKAPGSVD